VRFYFAALILVIILGSPIVFVFELEKAISVNVVYGLATAFIAVPMVFLILKKHRNKYSNERRKYFVRQTH
jgi:lipid-A-disaccharide synthase-like uncharacterized protein